MANILDGLKKRKLRINRNKIPKDFRDYLSRLQEIGEAVSIEEEVDWYLEIGAIIEYASEQKSQVPIFNKVKDAPGFRAAEYGPTVSSAKNKKWCRLAILLGLPEDSTPVEMQEAYIEARNDKVYEPIVVSNSDAECKENIMLGDDIDLFKFPAPMLHDGDYGRYIQTAGAIIVQTPCRKWTNWSISRGMIVDKKTMGCLWVPRQHNGIIYRMWKKLGKDCPFAIAIGVPPVAMTTLASAPPAWKNEYDYASSLLGKGLEMVKCETNDLLVPASSEIVIEGFVSATEVSVEGPFGEYPGYLADDSRDTPRANVECITYRNEAIVPICSPGIPVTSTHVVGGFFMSGDAITLFRQNDIPVIDGLYTFESAAHWFVIRVKDDWHETTGLSIDEFINKIAEIYWTHHVGFGCSKLIVVGQDIPPDNPELVIWAFATRNHPTLGVYHFPQYDSDGSGLQMYLDAVTKTSGRGGLVAYSCLPIPEKVGHPLEPVLSFETHYPKPLQDKIKLKWKDWKFK